MCEKRGSGSARLRGLRRLAAVARRLGVTHGEHGNHHNQERISAQSTLPEHGIRHDMRRGINLRTRPRKPGGRTIYYDAQMAVDARDTRFGDPRGQ